MFHVE